MLVRRSSVANLTCTLRPAQPLLPLTGRKVCTDCRVKVKADDWVNGTSAICAAGPNYCPLARTSVQTFPIYDGLDKLRSIRESYAVFSRK